ncbi:MAG: hypothetical protein IPM78_08465 [Moraxellaceae bacterium]|nr:hypothetical protein [Moraxellaceae bacterium]
MYALQVLQDSDLRQVEGRDGIELTIDYTQVDINKMYWEDQAGLATGATEQVLRAEQIQLKFMMQILAMV